MRKEIKQNLFRFVTLRNPQLIDKKESHPGFVYHPDDNYERSVYSEVLSETDEASKMALSKAVSDEFVPLKGRKGVKDYRQTIYDFSLWLMRNKNHLSYKSIKSNAQGVDNLTTEALLVIWDNLIYQTINKKSVYVREALIQVLIADQFFKAFKDFSAGLSGDILFTEDQEKEFVRRANASVVISKALLAATTIKPTTKEKRVSISKIKELENATDVALAKERVQRYQTLVEELKSVETKYKNENQVKYEKALTDYNQTIENLLKKVEPVIVEETNTKGEVSKIETYPNLDLPKFVYNKEAAINKEYLTNKISKDSLAILEEQGLDVHKDFSEVFDAVKTKVKDENEIILGKAPKQIKTLKVGGASVTVNPSLESEPYDYNISPLHSINPGGLRNINMLIFNYVQDSQITDVSYKITFNNGTEKTSTDFTIFNSGTTQILRLFPNLIAFPFGTLSYTLEGEITLEDQTKLSFSKLVKMKSRHNFGMFDLQNDDSGDNPVDSQVFGVTNLGIADFRRVEQEVCCYVPGEVSHIENIMAREYKERATRSLNSIETTSEETSERETEKLTDTTTTERNEMQSEVSSVINEDKSKNYGANASVSGKFGTTSFNAGAHFDASSSSSTSNSNSQAQTYAQEVTERAMERIVQKVSSKRTSRILKEFEENNKHGFDNTKGDKHITGVYRWVDKIYKNKLINYGKRLMYEFAIPEPARFLKDALIKKADDGQLDSGIILPVEPVKPSTIGLNSATNINESSYQGFASKYAAEVSAPVDQYLKIGRAFSKDDQSYDAKGYAFNDIDVPEGYYATSGTVNWAVIQKNNSHKFMSIGLGDSRHSVIGGSGSTSFYNFSDIYKKNIPFSFNTWYIHSGHFNVTINCTRSNEEYKQWQNETYTAIMDAYNDRLREYNEAMAANNIVPDNDEKVSFNPAFNRSLEKKELKRIAIELLIDQDRVSKNDYVDDSLVKVKNDEAFHAHAATVKFFEQAFDWDIMAYVLYPYFYAKQSDWKTLFQETDVADPIFQAFLQSGMARTVVPVRPGFEDAVNWYMSTGEIWNGEGLITDQDDDLYVSISEEMETVEGVVEETWETRLPTSLTVIQAGSIGLNVEGLPCNVDCDDFALFDSDGNPVLDSNGNPLTNNPIEQTDVLIGGASGVGGTGTEELKMVEFTFVDNTGSNFANIGEYDAEGAFPLVFKCMDQKIEIQREAQWHASNSVGVIYQKLAEQVSLISGIQANQVFSKKGDPLGIRFKVEIAKIPTFTFEKFVEKGAFSEPNHDLLKLIINDTAVKVISPTVYLDRIFDKANTGLKEAELNINLPIDRFLV